MTKAEQIAQTLTEKPQVGDRVNVNIPYEKSVSETIGKGKNKQVVTSVLKNNFVSFGILTAINIEDGENILYISFGTQRVPTEVYKKYIFIKNEASYGILEKFVTKSTDHCGSNPFKKDGLKIKFHNQPISTLLYMADYRDNNNILTGPEYNTVSEREGKYAGLKYGGINLNPTIKDNEGNIICYQRDFVWTLKQKQLLIDSIYNGIEIGKFIFKYNNWEKIMSDAIENGHGYDWDCVDGKQRFNTIVLFCLNEFPDSYGNYFKDLSVNAQNKFLDYSNLTLGKLDEKTTDSEIIETFLTINFTGTPMSEEHIQFVQKIKI